MLENVVLAAYFLGKPDLQRPDNHRISSFEYIRKLYESSKALKLNLIIFHDHFSSEVINKYSTDRIKFIRVSLKTQYSLNDERFLIMKEHLEENKYGKVLMVDAGDVWFGRNPFDFISNSGKLYFGDEDKLIGESTWMRDGFSQLYGEIPDKVLDNKILNCGVIGGEYSEVLKLLTRFNNELKTINNTSIINDMIVFNKLVYSDYDQKDIIHGSPFNSPFKSFLSSGDYYIYHK